MYMSQQSTTRTKNPYEIRRDFRSKERIVLRELKEAKVRLRLLLAVKLLSALKRRAAITAGVLGIWLLGFGIWVLM